MERCVCAHVLEPPALTLAPYFATPVLVHPVLPWVLSNIAGVVARHTDCAVDNKTMVRLAVSRVESNSTAAVTSARKLAILVLAPLVLNNSIKLAIVERLPALGRVVPLMSTKTNQLANYAISRAIPLVIACWTVEIIVAKRRVTKAPANRASSNLRS